MPQCADCTKDATRVLVDYNHNVINPKRFFCEKHAADSGRELCPCCNSYKIETEDEEFNEVVLPPVYAAGELDEEGCCSEHP